MADFAKTTKAVAAAALTTLAAESLVPNEAKADILRDNISDSTNYNGLGQEGALNFADLLGGSPSLFDGAAGMSFVGDGNAIDTIEMIWQYGDNDLGWNQGDLEGLNWRAAIFLNPNDFTVEGLFGRDGYQQPDFFIDLADPTNPDYATPIGSSGLANNHHAIVDVSDLNWSTIAGQESLAFLVPVGELGGSLGTFAALSSDLGETIGLGTDMADWAADGGLGPRPLGDFGYPHDSIAGRVTSIPAPGTLALVGGSLVFGFRRRRA